MKLLHQLAKKIANEDRYPPPPNLITPRTTESRSHRLNKQAIRREVEITDTNFLKQKSCHDEQPDDFWCCFSALHPQLLSGKNTALNLFLIYMNNMCLEDRGFQFIILPLHLGHDPLHALC